MISKIDVDKFHVDESIMIILCVYANLVTYLKNIIFLLRVLTPVIVCSGPKSGKECVNFAMFE